MTLTLCRMSRLVAMTAFASAALPHHASAQASDTPAQSPLLSVKVTVPAGEVVDVTDVRGTTITGVLVTVTSDVVEITVGDKTRAMFARDVQRIRWRQQDSWVTGALIGAGIGAIPGIWYLVADPNECAGLCPEEYALVGLGALVGALVDKVITRKVTVYEHPAKSARGTVALSAVLTGARWSMQLTVSF